MILNAWLTAVAFSFEFRFRRGADEIKANLRGRRFPPMNEYGPLGVSAKQAIGTEFASSDNTFKRTGDAAMKLKFDAPAATDATTNPQFTQVPRTVLK